MFGPFVDGVPGEVRTQVVFRQIFCSNPFCKLDLYFVPFRFNLAFFVLDYFAQLNESAAS